MPISAVVNQPSCAMIMKCPSRAWRASLGLSGMLGLLKHWKHREAQEQANVYDLTK